MSQERHIVLVFSYLLQNIPPRKSKILGICSAVTLVYSNVTNSRSWMNFRVFIKQIGQDTFKHFYHSLWAADFT